MDPLFTKNELLQYRFIGGFLFNLRVDAMEQPAGYSEAAIKEIAKKYTAEAGETNKTRDQEAPKSFMS